MAVRTVIRLGHPNLRRKAEPYPVDLIGSPDFLSLIGDMVETLHAYGGIGLAAPQVDLGYRIAIIEIENTSTRYGEMERVPLRVYVNPTIRIVEQGSAGYWEGCLSIPGMRGFVERPQHILVDYTDDRGRPRQVRADGFPATVFQHEFDHLDGILYVDRIKDLSKFAFEEEYLAFHHCGE